MKNIIHSPLHHRHRLLHVGIICYPVFLGDGFDDHFINVTKNYILQI